MFDIRKTITRLLRLSQLIIDEVDVLANLSYYDMEESSQFDDHISDIKDYLNQEQVILNNIDATNLVALYEELNNTNDDSDTHIRCIVNVDERLSAIMNYIDSLPDDCDDDCNDYTENEATEDDEEYECEDFIQKYHVDEGDTEKYALNVIDNVATIVIKKMLKRIESTLASDKQDIKYKKKLIRNFKRFKYFYFSLDNQLEILGSYYRFNVDNIPMPVGFSIDTSQIFHNQCVTILDKLYSFKDIDFDPDIMCEVLFNMMMFEEYLIGIPNESIDKLLELSSDLEEHHGCNYFGNIAKTKLLEKKN